MAMKSYGIETVQPKVFEPYFKPNKPQKPGLNPKMLILRNDQTGVTSNVTLKIVTEHSNS